MGMRGRWGLGKEAGSGFEVGLAKELCHDDS